jgi:pyruvate formate lyase activating enzyme
LISNGFINEKPLRELCKYINAANINLKGFDENIYQKLNGGSLQPVLNTLKIMKELNIWLEITHLIVPSWTDNMTMIKKMCDWLATNGFTDYPLHFLRFFPMYKLQHLQNTPVSILEKAKETALHAGMKYIYIGNVPGHSANHTYCHKCKKMILERTGYLITKNNMVNGSCKFCNEKIPGIWS